MTKLYKHETIANRPVLRTQEKPERESKSQLTQNRLLKKLQPSKASSSVSRSFRRFFSHISQFFKVKHPDSIQENRAHLIRPIDSTPLTVGNLWHYYAHFLKEDKECPKRLKSCFQKMERDEMQLDSLHRKKVKEEEKAPLVLQFADDKLKSLNRLKKNHSSLLLLTKSENAFGDQSLSGDLFSVVTRTQTGYTITFLGSDEAMLQLDRSKPSFAAGKEKIPRQVIFEISDLNVLMPLLTFWASPEKVSLRDVVSMTETWTKKEPTSLEDGMSSFTRPDKLFWNIVGAIPGRQGAVSRASIRSIRLRTELLSLYESFDEIRVFSNASSREFRDFNKLLTSTSAKVLLYYEKGYLSKEDLDQIVKRLTIMEEALQGMQRKAPAIPRKVSFDPIGLEGTPLRKSGIQPPQTGLAVPEDMNPGGALPSSSPLNFHLNAPVSLEIPKISTITESKAELERLHSQLDAFRQGTLENRESYVNDILSFFIRVDVQKLHQERAKAAQDWYLANPLLDPKEWQDQRYASLELTELLQKAIDLTEVIQQTRSVRTISQYDYEGVVGSADFVVLLSYFRSGYVMWSCLMRHAVYGKFIRSITSGYVGGKISLSAGRNTLHGLPGLSVSGDDPIGFILNHSTNPPPKEAYDLVFKHRRILMKLFEDHGIGELDSKQIEKKLEWNQWMRPLADPYLKGLYREAQMTLYRSKKEDGPPTVPEAYFDNPAGVFDYYRETKGKQFSHPGSEKDMQMLSRLLANDFSSSPIKETKAFMLEQPHLMRNPDIRNFLDAIFHHYRVPPGLDLVIDKTKKEFQTNPNKEHFDLLLYYHELQPIHDINEIRALVALSRDNPDLNASYGYAVRVLLRAFLDQASEIKENDFGEILTLFADAKTAHVDLFNVDPLFEKKLERIWMQIEPVLKDKSAELVPFLERICLNKGFPLDRSEWQHQGNLVFANDQHVIDLKTWEISSPGLSAYTGKLPHRVRQNSLVGFFLKGEDLAALKVSIEHQDACTLYSFEDSNGIATRIEERNDSYFLYKQIEVNGALCWLQATDFREKPEKQNALTQLLELEFDQKQAKQIPFLKEGLYVNPSNPKEGYLLDGAKAAFKVSLKKNSIQSWTDLRRPLTTGPWELCRASDIEEKGLEFLKTFENSDSVLLFSKKGSLKKVELVRYSITFALKGGKLVSETEPFVGYAINPDGDTKGFTHALVLEHPTKGKKLLFPDARALRQGIEILQPEGRGFAKIGMAVEKAKRLKNLIQGRYPSIVTRTVESFKSQADSLNFNVVDLRTYTEEICQPKELLELMKHALISGKPELALSLFAQFPMKDKKMLQQLMKFTNVSHTQSAAEAAFKIKVALSIYRHLKGNHQLKNELKALLRHSITENGKLLLAYGRQIPAPLRLSSEEMNRLALAVKKTDPEFYKNHVSLHLAEEGVEWDPEASPLVEIKVQKELKIEQRIAALEAKIHPEERLEELSAVIPKLEVGEPLLFGAKKVAKLFKEPKTRPLNPIQLVHPADESPCEKAALDTFQGDLDKYQTKESARLHYILKPGRRRIERFIDKELVPLQDKQTAKMDRCEKRILKAISHGMDTETKAALLSGHQSLPSLAELRLAFVRGSLDTLKISPACDLEVLKTELTSYFDALSRKNAAGQAIQLLERMKVDKSKNQKNWELASDELHRLLTLERKYDPIQNPMMLVFEAQLAKNLKELPGGLNQLDLLEALLSDPTNLILAPTGAGKTAVLSVLEALLKPTGRNLVVQKILPALYQQTYDQVNDIIGDLFNTQVMPLRFNLQMPLTKSEYYKEEGEEKTRSTSIFKGMYEELMLTMENKGCVLSDYSSLPMMEAKFLQLGHQMKLTVEEGGEVTALQREHHQYLRKILILLRNKDLEGMDEYDQPNRPTQKLQLDMQLGSKEIPEFFIDTSLEIFELLAQDPELKFKDNLQQEVSNQTREAALQKAAKEMAKGLAPALENQLYLYFIGESEEVLDLLHEAPEVLDKIAFCKEQFAVYLPLTLDEKGGSKYKRSEDGSRTLPCSKGTPNPKAKQGTVYEQINYTIADYLQNGVTFYDLEQWMFSFKPEWEKASPQEKVRLQQEIDTLFPEGTPFIEIESRLRAKDPALISDKQIPIFLKARLRQIKSSGFLISIDPVNVIDMARATSGISATSGAPASMHPNFKLSDTAGSVKAGMGYRIYGRASDPNRVIAYNPANPNEIFTKISAPPHAVIDAAGAFKDAQALKDANPNLDQVGYYLVDGSIAFLGNPTDSLERTGFFFNEANTRGADRDLDPQAKAVITFNGKKGFDDCAQAEGRLRKAGQTYELAMPEEHAKQNITEVLSSTISQDGKANAPNVYRGQSQLIRADLRNQVMLQLLNQETVEGYIQLLQNEDYFNTVITNPEKTYHEPGAFFKEKQHIIPSDTKPEKALEAIHKQYMDRAARMNLALKPLTLTQEIIDQMPQGVSAYTESLDCDLEAEFEQEVEAELELEAELEVEVELEQEVENEESQAKAGLFYPPWDPRYLNHSVQGKIHPAYDPRIQVSENFLPFKRNKTNAQFLRLPFERSMYNIGVIDYELSTQEITILDPIAHYYTPGWVETDHAKYDVRLDEFDKVCIPPPEFYKMIVQVKFLDGRTSGYSNTELDDLEAWLIANNPVEMKRHMLQDILRFRFREKAAFENSQLGQLFHKLIPNALI